MDIDIEDYYRRYAPMVLRRCRYLLGDEDRALDAMQDVFVSLMTNVKSLKGAYPSGLLHRMATNRCLNIIRDDRRKALVPGDEILDRIARYDTAGEVLLLTDLLDRVFGKEAVSTREIAVLHYVDGMTLEEVSREVGLSVSGVRKRLRRLQESARDILKEEMVP